jgi:alpha-tubulin suppressor-like RCC1 family protein
VGSENFKQFENGYFLEDGKRRNPNRIADSAGPPPLDSSSSGDDRQAVKIVGSTITAGESDSCGLDATGRAYCWGGNLQGQLGDGTTTDRSTPVAVSTAQTFSAIAAGSGYTVALTSTGNAFAWGNNGAGQLGDGTTTSRSTPVAVTAY